MKPPRNAVLFRVTDPYGRVDPDDWKAVLKAGEEWLLVPMMMHGPTGLLFGLGDDESHPAHVLSYYAVPLGQFIAVSCPPATVQKLGRAAILMYFREIGALEIGADGRVQERTM